MSTPTPTKPVIVILADDHAEQIESELRARYDRDYDVRVGASMVEGKQLLKSLITEQHPVAMIVCEYLTQSHTAIQVYTWLLPVLTTARRVVMLPTEQFRDAVGELREAQAGGLIDAYFVIPRGPRDEEFHAAVTDLLSDWTWSSGSVSVDFAYVVVDTPNADVARIRDFLDRMGVPTRTLGVDTPIGQEVLAIAQAQPEEVVFPLVSARGGPVFGNPSLAQLGSAMTMPTDLPGTDDIADLLIVGAGPAGLAAAVYGASEGLNTLVLDREAIGGQAGTSSMIRNYLGFPRGISGMRLAQRARMQATRFGARFLVGWQVDALVPGDGRDPIHEVFADGRVIRARTVLISAGVDYRRLGVEPLEHLIGRGVNYGAATSTASEMKHKRVFVVGGGNSAGQAAVHLSRFASSVSILVRRPDLSETMSDYLIREIAGRPPSTCAAARSSSTVGERGACSGCGCATCPRARSRPSTPMGCTCCWAPSRTATGSRIRCAATTTASCWPAATCPSRSGSTAAHRWPWAAPCRASSSPATSAPGR